MMTGLPLTILILGAVVLVATIAARPRILETLAGRVTTFGAFFILPVLLTTVGTSTHLEHAKTTEFCLSCHVMEPWGESLWLDDEEHLPASHFQNHRVSPDTACFDCHTTYTMYGDFTAKMKGLKHVWVQYIGTVPETIELYEPYENRECLHCHGGARSFEEDELHMEYRAEFDSGETSCLECHDLAHETSDLEGEDLWEGRPQ